MSAAADDAQPAANRLLARIGEALAAGRLPLDLRLQLERGDPDGLVAAWRAADSCEAMLAATRSTPGATRLRSIGLARRLPALSAAVRPYHHRYLTARFDALAGLATRDVCRCRLSPCDRVGLRRAPAWWDDRDHGTKFARDIVDYLDEAVWHDRPGLLRYLLEYACCCYTPGADEACDVVRAVVPPPDRATLLRTLV